MATGTEEPIAGEQVGGGAEQVTRENHKGITGSPQGELFDAVRIGKTGEEEKATIAHVAVAKVSLPQQAIFIIVKICIDKFLQMV